MMMQQYNGLRPRRLRISAGVRSLVRENVLRADDFVYPLFVVPGNGVRNEVKSLPGVFQLSVDMALEEARRAYAAGVPAIMLFGLPDYKDPQGSSAWDGSQPVQQAMQAIKRALPELVVMGDVCMCEYTSHGHCGLLTADGYVENDSTLELLGKVAVSQADAGADMVAPSDMMDGRVAAIRAALDASGHQNVSIMSYAAKYASAYYGPFRDAAGSAPQFGDRKTYQMDPANSREALKEVAIDIQEGADIVMVKPALAYMDVIRQVRDRFDFPVAAYNVSGEYAMIKAAALNGWIEEERMVLETLLGMKRAGADIILSYPAVDAANWLAKK